jgi:phosphoribosylformylglycinamidine synthase
VRQLIGSGLASAVHDVSDGGLLVSVAEMALASGVGASLGIDFEGSADTLAAMLFGEDQGRYVVSIDRKANEKLIALANKLGIHIQFVGDTGGSDLNIGDAPGYSGHVCTIPLATLRAAHEGFLPELMEGCAPAEAGA